MNKDPIGRCLLFAYILSLFASHLIFPPLFEHHFQVSEWIFLLLVGYHWPLFTKWTSYKTYVLAAWPIALYLVVLVLAFLIHPTQGALYELGGGIYLFFVAFLFFHKGVPLLQSTKYWDAAMIGLAMLILTPLAIDFFSLLLFDYAVFELWRTNDAFYPYIGQYARPQGWHFTPTMLVAVLIIPFYYLYLQRLRDQHKRTLHLLVLLLSGLTLLLTLSKDLFFVFGLMILPFLINSNKFQWRTVGGLLLLPLIAIQQFLTLYIPVFKNTADIEGNIIGAVPSIETPAFTILQVEFYESTYFLLRYAQWHMLDNMRFWGHGLDQFQHQYAVFQPEELRYLGNYSNIEVEAHQTYFAAFFEMGVPGLVAVLLLFIIPLFRLGKQLPGNTAMLFLFGVLLFYALIGLSTDVEDFRTLWVILGLSFGMLHQAGK